MVSPRKGKRTRLCWGVANKVIMLYAPEVVHLLCRWHLDETSGQEVVIRKVRRVFARWFADVFGVIVGIIICII